MRGWQESKPANHTQALVFLVLIIYLHLKHLMEISSGFTQKTFQSRPQYFIPFTVFVWKLNWSCIPWNIGVSCLAEEEHPSAQMYLYTYTQDFKLHMTNSDFWIVPSAADLEKETPWFPPASPSFWDRTGASTSPSWGSSLGPNELRWAKHKQIEPFPQAAPSTLQLQNVASTLAFLFLKSR